MPLSVFEKKLFRAYYAGYFCVWYAIERLFGKTETDARRSSLERCGAAFTRMVSGAFNTLTH